MIINQLAPCNNRTYYKKDSCKRYLEEDIKMVIRFENLMVDSICNYYIEKLSNIVATEEKESSNEETKDEGTTSETNEV